MSKDFMKGVNRMCNTFYRVKKNPCKQHKTAVNPNFVGSVISPPLELCVKCGWYVDDKQDKRYEKLGRDFADLVKRGAVI